VSAAVGARDEPLGAILAGGESRRYGAPKALATVGGVRIIDRVRAVLERVVPDLVLLANEPDLFQDLGLPTRPDIRPGLGALGGIHTGLHWARELGRPGVLAVACDMPFPCEALLHRLRDVAFNTPAGSTPPDVAIPESRGRRGVEPLFAAYGIGCLPAIEAQIQREDHRMIGFLDAVAVRRIPVLEVEALCDPGRAFLNVNTPDERERAEALEKGDHGQ
jgi:molybdopterin-guanine dinucleotide biosynthesis protein